MYVFVYVCIYIYIYMYITIILLYYCIILSIVIRPGQVCLPGEGRRGEVGRVGGGGPAQ